MATLHPPETALERAAEEGRQETPALDILLVLARDRRRIIAVTLIALLVGTLIAFAMKPSFTAVAIILPPQTPQSSASLLAGQLSALGAFGGGASSLLRNPADMYVGILQSRTIADHLIAKFQLQSLWKLKRSEDTRKKLAKQAIFEVAKNGLISISVKDHDPRRASDLANAFVDELYAMNSKLAITEASQRRLFFDQRLAEEKSALAAAEDDLRKTQEKTGLITVSGQAEMAIRSIAQTQAQISSRLVELQAMRAYATDENPSVYTIQREIDALRQQLSKQQDDQKKMAPGDTLVPAGKVPEGSLEYARKLREVKYHDTLFELLSRQYEAARIDEAKSAPIIQVVDRAVPPDRKSGPSRLLLMIGSAVLGFCCACLWVYLRAAIARMRKVPELSIKLDRLREAVRLRW
ncbi:GumC family protein [Edaphobacter aggregans]|uniref:GumC family protein n=1 Tax=Edaphobacter aggregans TaxID=570835 RepID=UPI000A8D6D89|nr:Wzz/FepE/Etk N-terminal domain-containing protein [Edaphobacter aggregans]